MFFVLIKIQILDFKLQHNNIKRLNRLKYLLTFKIPDTYEYTLGLFEFNVILIWPGLYCVVYIINNYISTHNIFIYIL